jgi:hypothetical protein
LISIPFLSLTRHTISFHSPIPSPADQAIFHVHPIKVLHPSMNCTNICPPYVMYVIHLSTLSHYFSWSFLACPIHSSSSSPTSMYRHHHSNQFYYLIIKHRCLHSLLLSECILFLLLSGHPSLTPIRICVPLFVFRLYLCHNLSTILINPYHAISIICPTQLMPSIHSSYPP